MNNKNPRINVQNNSLFHTEQLNFLQLYIFLNEFRIKTRPPNKKHVTMF